MATITIDEVKRTELAGLFTISFLGEDDSEFDKFIKKFKEDADKKEDLFIVLNALNRMLLESGFLERYFRPEGKYNDHVVALPIEKTNIRLYCLRMSDSVLIVGNGGIKKRKTYQEDDNLNGYVIALQQLDKLLKKEIMSGKVKIEKTKITGIDNTLFEI